MGSQPGIRSPVFRTKCDAPHSKLPLSNSSRILFLIEGWPISLRPGKDKCGFFRMVFHLPIDEHVSRRRRCTQSICASVSWPCAFPDEWGLFLWIGRARGGADDTRHIEIRFALKASHPRLGVRSVARRISCRSALERAFTFSASNRDLSLCANISVFGMPRLNSSRSLSSSSVK